MSDAYSVFRRHGDVIKWCTPSILPEVLALDADACEGSIVLTQSGDLLTNSGYFRTLHESAARAYGNSGHSHYCCEGTTGSNRVLFRLLRSIMKNDEEVLATRNVHQSVVENARSRRVPLRYMRTRYDSDAEIFLPPEEQDVLDGLTDKTRVVLLSTPTYEGYSCDVRSIVDKVRARNPDILVYVDEAWGAHLAFHPDLPDSGTQAGADFVVQSIHKHGGAPNPASVMHLGRRATDLYYDEFLRTIGSGVLATTYSFPLIARMDYARSILEQEGQARIDRLFEVAERLRNEVNRGNLSVLGDRSEYSRDPTKVTVDVRRSGVSGYDVQRKLMERGIAVSNWGQGSVTFLTTFQLSGDAVVPTVDALRGIVGSSFVDSSVASVQIPANLEKVVDPWNVVSTRDVHLEESAGLVLGEDIKCYPPGVFIGQVGERVSSEFVEFLQSIKGRAKVVATDKSLDSLVVADEF
ncbi:hypothetical protein COV18_01960 [Candidatus Woesearchaeota archaeon CG10_big_fil_rev_8_21_14_0_10_37_12]|nr:MAG: hypothetical protein COV18_01960 [Candidatus Woesearchaeota archaeon CG10_big_fil_rev_8_21_14_0_10_37_12]